MDSSNLPEHCNGCGENFTLNHAQVCQNGGNIIARHNEIISELISLGTMAFKGSAVQDEPQIHPGSYTAPSSKSGAVAGTDDRGDVLIQNLCVNGQDAIIDV